MEVPCACPAPDVGRAMCLPQLKAFLESSRESPRPTLLGRWLRMQDGMSHRRASGGKGQQQSTQSGAKMCALVSPAGCSLGQDSLYSHHESHSTHWRTPLHTPERRAQRLNRTHHPEKRETAGLVPLTEAGKIHRVAWQGGCSNPASRHLCWIAASNLRCLLLQLPMHVVCRIRGVQHGCLNKMCMLAPACSRVPVCENGIYVTSVIK